MNASIPRAIVALFALTFIVAACASDSVAEWTFDPSAKVADRSVPAPADEVAAEPEAPADEVAAEPEAPADEAPADTAAAPAGEPRVIALQADAALRFTDPDGQPLTDIAVTPGETISIEVNNTAGFPHNFWIGTDEELIVANGSTDTGIPDWSTGVQVLEWVVPDDISNLKFGCTVPGHYTLMQGTFSADEAPADEVVAEPEAPADEAPADTAAAPAGEPRVIEIEADAAIRFLQNGEQIQDIGVTPGETVLFRVTNTAGFPHNFYIGADEELQVMGGTTDTGLPDWDTGVQELEWVVPEDISDLRFACTVPGHYFTMQGDFTVSQ